MYMYEAGRSGRTIARARNAADRMRTRLSLAVGYVLLMRRGGIFGAESCASDAKALLAAPAVGSFIEVDPEN